MWNRPCTSPLRPSSPQMRLRQHQVHTVPAYCSLSLTGTLLCHSGDKQGCHALKDSQSMAQLSCVSPPRPHRVRSADCLPVQQSGLGPTNAARLHRMRANRGPRLLARGGFRTRGPCPRLEPGRLRVRWSWVRGGVTGRGDWGCWQEPREPWMGGWYRPCAAQSSIPSGDGVPSETVVVRVHAAQDRLIEHGVAAGT